MSLRMLITGSRTWVSVETIEAAMDWHALGSTDITVIHGHCPSGADTIADQIAVARSWTVQRRPANWTRWGRAAGYRRNADMVTEGADVCLAFIRNSSKGASMCARLAEKAGIATYRFTESGPDTHQAPPRWGALR